MPHNRYYLDIPTFCIHTTVSLEGEESRHLIRVMRAREQDEVELINGRGELALCTVEKIEKEKGILRINHVHKELPLSPHVILALALLRPSSLEWAIEKATELGAASFWLFPGLRSEKKELSAHQKGRLQSILISACKQSGRLYIPQITYKQELIKLDLNKETEGMTPLICDPGAPYLRSISYDRKSPLLLFIGPEGGLADQEKEVLKNLQGALTASLHPNILRAETAPLAALSILFQT